MPLCAMPAKRLAASVGLIDAYRHEGNPCFADEQVERPLSFPGHSQSITIKISTSEAVDIEPFSASPAKNFYNAIWTGTNRRAPLLLHQGLARANQDGI